MGIHSVRVEKPADLRSALGDGLHHPGPALIELVTDPNVLEIPPHVSTEQVRQHRRSDRRGRRVRPPQDINGAVKLVNAIFGVGYLATSQTASPHPDQEVISAVKAVYAAFISPPHAVLHLWAGGLDPANPDVRGTVSYFNELAVDPVFWMLHTELDHWWYTWQQSHTGVL